MGLVVLMLLFFLCNKQQTTRTMSTDEDTSAGSSLLSCYYSRCHKNLDLESLNGFVVCPSCEDAAYCDEKCLEADRANHSKECVGIQLQIFVYQEEAQTTNIFKWQQYTIPNKIKNISNAIKRFKPTHCCICSKSEKDPHKFFYYRHQESLRIETIQVQFNWIAYACSSLACQDDVAYLVKYQAKVTQYRTTNRFKMCIRCCSMNSTSVMCPLCCQSFYCDEKCRREDVKEHLPYCSKRLVLF